VPQRESCETENILRRETEPYQVRKSSIQTLQPLSSLDRAAFQCRSICRLAHFRSGSRLKQDEDIFFRAEDMGSIPDDDKNLP